MTNTTIQKLSNPDEYFAANDKFFNAGDSNAKKAFFMLGQYCKKVMECNEKQIAENGGRRVPSKDDKASDFEHDLQGV